MRFPLLRPSLPLIIGALLTGNLAGLQASAPEVHPALADLASQAGDVFNQAEARLNEAPDAERPAAREAFDRASVLAGPNGWLFTLNDLRHHAAGQYWGEDAAKVVAAARHPDPFPAIVGFAEQVRQAGGQLIVVPVPSKIALYPEELHADLAGWEDPFLPAFIDSLQEAGVEALDILPLLRELQQADVLSHLPGDTHWSPQAVEAVADALVELMARPEGDGNGSVEVAFHPQERMVLGDLAARVGGQRESISYRRVTFSGEPVRSSPSGSVVLMGDSHGLVFGHPDLLATGAGLAEHLAGRLHKEVDLIAAMGSGANASRIALARRSDNLAGKEVFIWVFAERELSRSTSGWPAIPVVR